MLHRHPKSIWLCEQGSTLENLQTVRPYWINSMHACYRHLPICLYIPSWTISAHSRRIFSSSFCSIHSKRERINERDLSQPSRGSASEIVLIWRSMNVGVSSPPRSTAVEEEERLCDADTSDHYTSENENWSSVSFSHSSQCWSEEPLPNMLCYTVCVNSDDVQVENFKLCAIRRRIMWTSQ